MLKRLLFVFLPLTALAQLPDSLVTDLVVSHRMPYGDYLYKGIPNPVEIAVPGVECGAFEVSCKGGVITGGGCVFVITPDITQYDGPLLLNVYWKDEKQSRTATGFYRTRSLPLPTAHFAGLGFEDDAITVSHANAGDGLVVAIRDQRLDDIGYRHPRFRIDHFQFAITRNCETLFTGRSNDAKLSPEMKASLQKVLPDDLIQFFEITYFDDFGVVQLASSIKLLVK